MACISSSAQGSRIRLAIVGAGAAGLAVARHALEQTDVFTPTVFEQGNSVGGTWIYHPIPQAHSSMYQNLKTNLPKEVMPFLDYPFPDNYSSFMTHEQVLKYLEDYTQLHFIRSCIQFASRVHRISPCHNQSEARWEVEIEKENQIRHIHHFDAVAICTGHYCEPRIPEIPGLKQFRGIVQHSHSYRTPDRFAGMRVLCLGAGASGIDISIDVASAASWVYLSHNKEKQFFKDIGENVSDVAGVIEAWENGFLLKDSTKLECDAIILCTGYLYSFPFLSTDCDVQTDGNFVFHLHEHIFNAYRPSMGFIGLNFIVAPFPLYDLQAQLFLKYLQGNITLPPVEDIIQENEAHFALLKSKEISLRFVHQLGDKQWDYFNSLARKIGCKPPAAVIQKIYEQTTAERMHNLKFYRERNYIIVSDTTFSSVSAKVENYL